MIVKGREGIIKKRIIVDTKESKLKEAIEKGQRVVMPRLLDAVYSTLQQLSVSDADPLSLKEHSVLDFCEAFWQLPFSPCERRYFCTKLNIDGCAKFIVFLRTVQRSRGAPLTWARFDALLTRFTQSLFSENEFVSLCCVDDPLLAVIGT